MKTSTKFTNLCSDPYTTVYLLTEGGQIYVPPSGRIARVVGGDSIRTTGECSNLDGAEVRERTPTRIDGWPTEPGHYIVTADVAKAAEALGLTVPGGHVYTLGPALPHDVDGSGKYNVRQWLTCWPNLTGEDPATAVPKPKLFPEGRAALVAMLEQVKVAEAMLPIGVGSAASFALADCRAVLMTALRRAE